MREEMLLGRECERESERKILKGRGGGERDVKNGEENVGVKVRNREKVGREKKRDGEIRSIGQGIERTAIYVEK